MMKRLSLILILLSLAVVQQVHAQYYSVNYDARTVAAMATAFGTEAVAESYYREQVDDILKHYNAAEVTTAGIFVSKFLEHKAFSDLGIWNSSTENYYYRRIYRMVSEKIMPKIWVVAKLMLRSPQTAIYWGSYLMKICDETKSLCMQFESVVTNSTLGFSDIVFLEINRNIAPLLKLSEVGDIDWQRMLDDLASVPGNFTKENLQHDIDNLYNMGVGLASAGIGNIGDVLLQTSSFHDLMGGRVSKVIDLYDHYGALFARPRFVDDEFAAVIFGAVQSFDGAAGLGCIGHFDKAEPLRAAAVTVGDEPGAADGAVSAEGIAELGFGHGERHVSHIDIHGFSFRGLATAWLSRDKNRQVLEIDVADCPTENGESISVQRPSGKMLRRNQDF